MIDLTKLTDADKGRQVKFTRHQGKPNFGWLSSWNERYVFVRFLGPNGEACPPAQCEFANG